MGSVEAYMEGVSKVLKNSTDPFATKHSQILISLIEIVANKNWLNNGEPILTNEQINTVYTIAKTQSCDKTWELHGKFNVCMN